MSVFLTHHSHTTNIVRWKLKWPTISMMTVVIGILRWSSSFLFALLLQAFFFVSRLSRPVHISLNSMFCLHRHSSPSLNCLVCLCEGEHGAYILLFLDVGLFSLKFLNSSSYFIFILMKQHIFWSKFISECCIYASSSSSFQGYVVPNRHRISLPCPNIKCRLGQVFHPSKQTVQKKPSPLLHEWKDVIDNA